MDLFPSEIQCDENVTNQTQQSFTPYLDEKNPNIAQVLFSSDFSIRPVCRASLL